MTNFIVFICFYVDKLTTSVNNTGGATTITNNSPQQLRTTTTTFLPNQQQTTSQTQTIPTQIRQLITNTANNPLQTQSTTNAQRLAEAAQRSPTNVSIEKLPSNISSLFS